jgi:2-oxoisovalerate dehydrogenase E2 component (dihydrolipoyl transacylase)
VGRLTVKVPDVGEGIAEVELVSWAVAEGETVARNQVVAEVMTDKATVEVPAPTDGVIEGLSGTVGDTLLVGSPLFALAVEGAEDSDVEAEIVTADPSPTESPGSQGPIEMPHPVSPAASPTPSPSPASTRGPASGPSRSGAPRSEGRRPTASPAVRRRARDGGIDLRTVVGSGPAGRITHDDLDAVFAAGPPTGLGAGTRGGPSQNRVADTAVADQPIVGLRRRIAEQMVASASTIPHITYVDEVDMTALEELRATLNDRGPNDEDRPRLTVLPFLVRALVAVMPRFPMMNAHVIESDSPQDPDALRTFGGVHVGIATQTDNGLVVPVVRHAEAETLWSTAARIGELANAARSGSAGRDDLTGSTITITSLGALGGLVTTPVINKPETAIVGVNKMTTKPVWIDDRFVPRQVMNLSCSFDHRVIDGWDAANFVQAIKQLLEQPALLFVEQS